MKTFNLVKMEKTKKSLIWGSVIKIIRAIKVTIRIFSRKMETISKLRLILRSESLFVSREAVTSISQLLLDLAIRVN